MRCLPLRGPVISSITYAAFGSAKKIKRHPSRRSLANASDLLRMTLSLFHKRFRAAIIPLPGDGLRPSGQLQTLLERRVAAHRRRHQETITFSENALDVVGVDVRMADRHVVLLAGLHHPRHPLEHRRML